MQHVILSEAHDDCVADIGNLLPSCIFKSLAHFFKEHTNRHRKTHGKSHGARCLNETFWKPRSKFHPFANVFSLMDADQYPQDVKTSCRRKKKNKVTYGYVWYSQYLLLRHLGLVGGFKHCLCSTIWDTPSH